MTKILPLVKRYWRETLLVVLLLLLFWGWQRLKAATTQRDASVHLADSAWTAVRYYKLKDGQRVAQVNTLELTVADLKQLGSELGTANVKLKQQVGSLSNLVGYWKGQAGFHSIDTVHVTDTTYIEINGQKVAVTLTAEKGFYTNGHLYDLTTYFPERKIFVHEYTYDLGGFELTAYRKRSGLFGLGRGQLVSDIKFGDPNLQVRSFQGIVVKQSPPLFYETRGFSLGVGVVLGILLGSKL